MIQVSPESPAVNVTQLKSCANNSFVDSLLLMISDKVRDTKRR